MRQWAAATGATAANSATVDLSILDFNFNFILSTTTSSVLQSFSRDRIENEIDDRNDLYSLALP